MVNSAYCFLRTLRMAAALAWIAAVPTLDAQNPEPPSLPAPPTATAPAPAPTESRLHVLTVDTTLKKGSALPVTLRLVRTPSKATSPLPLKISIVEDIAAGSGQILRSSAWMAAMVASLTINEPLVDMRIDVETAGRIEGPSAGGMFALGMLCLLKGESLPNDITMSASINPDGSLGPVNGIPQKLAAAKQAGLSRVLLPYCQRFDRDLTSGTQVDLASRSRELGLEPIFVRDLEEAYHATTGKHVCEFAPPTQEPSYTQSAFDFLSTECQKEIAAFESLRPKMDAVLKQKETRPAAQALLKKIRDDHAAGRDAFQSGKVFVASQLLREANGAFSVLQQLVQTSPKFTQEMRSSWMQQGDDLRARLSQSYFSQSDFPSSLSGGLLFAEQSSWLLDLSAKINRSQLMLESAQARMGEASSDKKILENLARERDYFTILLFYSNLYAENQVADNTYFSRLLGAMPPTMNPADLSQVRSWVPVLLQAQLASAEYFRAGSQLLPKPVRDDLLSDHQLATFYQFSQLASQNWQAYSSGAETTGDIAPAPQGMDPVLQSFLWANAYCHSSLLYQKYIGFGGHRDDRLEWQSLNRSSLIQILEVAQRNALAGIGMAGACGADTSILAMIYERASWFRDGNEDVERLRALQDYWRVAMFGKLCALLAQRPA